MLPRGGRIRGRTYCTISPDRKRPDTRGGIASLLAASGRAEHQRSAAKNRFFADRSMLLEPNDLSLILDGSELEIASINPSFSLPCQRRCKAIGQRHFLRGFDFTCH